MSMLFTRWGESICVFNLLYILNVNSGGQEFQEVRRAGGQGFRRRSSSSRDSLVRRWSVSRGQEFWWPGAWEARGSGSWEFRGSRMGQEAFRWDPGV